MRPGRLPRVASLVLLLLLAGLTSGCAGNLFVRSSPPAVDPPHPSVLPPEELPGPGDGTSSPEQESAPEPEPSETDLFPPPEPEGVAVPPFPPVEDAMGPEIPTPGGRAAVALTDQGERALREGRTDEAVVLLERSLAVDPNRSGTYLLLAEAYRQQGLAHQAVGLVHRAELLSGGEDGLTLDGLLIKGDCLLAAGQPREARAVFRRARRRAPGDPEVARRLASLPPG